MKTFKKLIAGLSLGLMVSAPIASAQIASADSLTTADVLPNSVDVLYQFNTGPMNPFEDFIVSIFNDVFSAENEAKTEASTLIEGVLMDNSFTLAMDITEGSIDDYSMPNMYFTMHIDGSDFNRLLELAKDGEEELETEQLRGYTIYILAEDQNFVQIKDLFVMTSDIALTRSMINAYEDASNATLAKQGTYMRASEKFLDDAFLNVYIDPSISTDVASDPFFGATIGSEDVNDNFLKALIAESISIEQNNEGFDFGIFVEGDKTALTNLNLLFDKYNFVPSFYKEISGDGIIFFMEHNNASAWIQDMKTIFAEPSDFMDMYNEFTAMINEETGVDFEKDILPTLKGKNAFAVHAADQLVPAITLLVELGNERTLAAASMNTISSNIQKRWANVDGYSYKLKVSGTAAFHQHSFDLSVIENDPTLTGNKEGFATVNLQMGITADGLLVISTHPELETIFRSGKAITSNASFKEVFSNSEEIASYIYFNFASLAEYLNNVMTETGAETKMIDDMNKGLAAWTDIYVKSYAEETTSWVFGSVRVDVDNMMGLEELLFPSYDYDYGDIPTAEDLIMISKKFCDVSSSDWFYGYVNDLASKYIVSGYEDGCFRPGNDVTRAEFLKMAVEAADWNGTFPWSAMSDSEVFFSDVQPEFWGAYYINQAAAASYVDGYEDGTFHPNDPITRAEAVQILYGMNQVLQNSTTSNPFEDIPNGDWFYNAVGAAYNEGLVSGKTSTTFDPHTNITRAESAKIVDLFLNLSDQGMNDEIA